LQSKPGQIPPRRFLPDPPEFLLVLKTGNLTGNSQEFKNSTAVEDNSRGKMRYMEESGVADLLSSKLAYITSRHTTSHHILIQSYHIIPSSF
jgi:hypothetical protein